MSEFPHELIREFQIRTRAAAGLPEYDPSDPTLPTLPSLAAAIATSDPSPPHLRCQNCKGRLLNGSQSFICVYCGARPQNDAVPGPICFSSTVGYRWLLRSLRLDGSELVKLPTNKTEKDQRQSYSQAEISLSDFLNFKVAWSADTEESRGSSSYAGIDPYNFFFIAKSDASDISITEPIMHAPVWNTGKKEATTIESQQRDHDIRSSETAVTSSKQGNSEAFSAWEANFQSADSESKAQDFQSFDFQNPPSVSRSSHDLTDSSADSGNRVQDSQSFGHAIDSVADVESVVVTQKDVLSNVTASSAFDQWDSNDLWKNLSSNGSQHAMGSAENNETLAHHPDNLSTSFDLFQDFQSTSTREKTASEEASKTVDEGSFDDWNDFIVPKELQVQSVAKNEVPKNNGDSFDEWNGFTGSNNQQDPSGSDCLGSNYQLSTPQEKSTEVDLFSPNSVFRGDFSDFPETNAVSTPDCRNSFPTDVPLSENPASNSVDLFLDFQSQPNNSSVPESSKSDDANKTLDGDPLGDWTDFTFGSKYQPSTSPNNASETLSPDFQSLPNNARIAENSTSHKENKTVEEDSFDDWNDFTGSNNMLDPSVTRDTVQKTVGGNSFGEWSYFTASTNMQDRSANATFGSKYQPSTSPKMASEIEFQDFQSQSDKNRVHKDKTPDVPNKAVDEDSLCAKYQPSTSPNKASETVSPDFQSLPNKTRMPENSTSHEVNKTVDEDSFDDWKDFTGSNNMQDPSVTRDNVQKAVGGNSFDESSYLTASINMQERSESASFASKYQPSTSPKKASETEFQDFQSQADKNGIHEDKTPDVLNEAVDEDSLGDWNDFTFGSTYLSSNPPKRSSETDFLDFQMQPSNSRIFEYKTSDTASKTLDEDSFDDWNDFTSSNNMQDSSVTTDEVHKTVEKDSFDEWNDFTVSTNVQDSSGSNYQPSTSPNKSLETEFQDFQLQPNNSRLREGQTSDEANKTVDDDSFGVWNGFTGANNLQDPSLTMDETHKAADEESFADWNDFTASAHVQDPSGIPYQPSTSEKKPSEIDLFFQNSVFEGDLSNFSRRDLNSTSSSKHSFLTDATSPDDPASKSVNLFLDFQWQPIINAGVPENTRTDKAHKTVVEDSFDKWNEFTGSTNLMDPSGKPAEVPKTFDEDSCDEWSDFAGSTNQEGPSGNDNQLSNCHKKSSEMELLGQKSGFDGNFSIIRQTDLVSTSNSNNNFPADSISTGKTASGSIDFFQGFQWQPTDTNMITKTTKDEAQRTEDEDSFDEWNDFTGSTNLQYPIGTTDEGHKTADGDSFGEWNDFTGTTNLQNPPGTTGKEHKRAGEDSFDEWNDFTGPTNPQNSSGSASLRSNYELSTSLKKSSEVDLFSLNSGFEGDLARFPERNLVTTSSSDSNFPNDPFFSGSNF